VPGRRTRPDIIPQRDHERCPPPRPGPQRSPTPKEHFFSGTIPHPPEALDALRKPLERGPPLRTWHDPSVVVSVSAYSGDPHLCPLQSRVSTRFCSGSEGSRRYPPGERGDPIEATPLVRRCAHDSFDASHDVPFQSQQRDVVDHARAARRKPRGRRCGARGPPRRQWWIDRRQPRARGFHT